MERVHNEPNAPSMIGLGLFYELTVRIPSGKSPAEVLTASGERIMAEQGARLGLGDLILTRGDWIELRAPSGETYRLSPGSEFTLKPVPIRGEVGISPVYYGGVMPILANGKYRTSCWIKMVSSALIEAVDGETDAYYALTEPVHVYEFDESGRYFEIVTVNVGEKVLLSHRSTGPVRERYTVLSRQRIGEDEARRIFEEYLSPVRWAR